MTELVRTALVVEEQRPGRDPGRREVRGGHRETVLRQVLRIGELHVFTETFPNRESRCGIDVAGDERRIVEEI
jgi:hypothetical protein